MSIGGCGNCGGGTCLNQLYPGSLWQTTYVLIGIHEERVVVVIVKVDERGQQRAGMSAIAAHVLPAGCVNSNFHLYLTVRQQCIIRHL